MNFIVNKKRFFEEIPGMEIPATGYLMEDPRKTDDTVKQGEVYRDKVVPTMHFQCGDINALEMMVPEDMWSVPTYIACTCKSADLRDG
ncbi:MAG: hypothetical protein JRC66_02065 [Deltaproteobacteria bacterium]|nr:hypothetical protein [Deltaproteobacteria bacterium]